MKPPLSPPPFEQLFEGLSKEEFSLALQQAPLVKGKYLHWDQLRHRTPPEGLTCDSWWWGIKTARSASLKDLPFRDSYGRPFFFGSPDPVQQSLHRIDLNAAGRVMMESQMVSGEDRDRYLVSSLIEEALTSSQLEGAATTREEAKSMLRSGRRPRDRSEQMVVNNYRVMEYLRES